MLKDILTGLAEIEKEIEGVREAHSKVPEGVKDFPCFINMPSEGTIVSFGRNRSHIIIATLLVDRAELPQAQEKTLPFLEIFPNKVDEKSDLNGKCGSASVKRYFDYGVHSFAGVDYFGVSFEIECLE